jgi:uncharacterized protein YdeI (YjbR/CyaY-like superfamily)
MSRLAVTNVNEFIEKNPYWTKELRQLHAILKKTKMEETIKWGGPVFCVNGQNVVGMGAFKSYFGLWFFQGALLDDPNGLLINAQDGKTKAQRQLRFQSSGDIRPRVIEGFLKQAIANARAGKTIKANRNSPLDIPAELEQALRRDRSARAAFETLSLSCKREYAEYIATAKRDETKAARLEKILPMIRDKTGLNDRYRR